MFWRSGFVRQDGNKADSRCWPRPLAAMVSSGSIAKPIFVYWRVWMSAMASPAGRYSRSFVSEPMNALVKQSINLSTEDGESLAFASMQLDYKNLIAEIEPVGTRTKAQRQGFARSLLLRCLSYMKGQGIKTAYIRTDVNNRPAISTYESVGFEIRDNLYTYHRQVSDQENHSE